MKPALKNVEMERKRYRVWVMIFALLLFNYDIVVAKYPQNLVSLGIGIILALLLCAVGNDYYFKFGCYPYPWSKKPSK
jgi:dolichol kinase